MYTTVRNFLLLLPILVAFGCSAAATDPPPASTVSANTAVFDPSLGNVPLPNILATATAADPLLNRAVNKPMDPSAALAYVNQYEMGGTSAVSGLNAPIYIRFQQPVDPATVTPATVKVFQLGIDSNGLTENSSLGFTDISALFDYSYSADTVGTTVYPNLHLFPKFPLLPGTRYLYVVTSGVKDAASGRSLSGSFYFEALKATTPLLGAFAGLEAIRDNVYADAGKTIVKLSGYAKVMDDLITASATTKVASRNDISLLGRFITTCAGYVSKDGTGSTASMMPVESALRAFSAGAALGGLTGKTWTNTVTVTTTFDKGGVNPSPDAYWSAVMKAATTAPATVKSVVNGTINSADLSIDPVVAKANAATMDLSAVAGAYNPAAGVVQAFRTGANLTGYYHTLRSVPFVLITPTTSNGKVVIFQHGITGQKEQVVAVAGSLTAAGYTVAAIDLPLHGALAVAGHTTGAVWGQDFMAIGAPLATRSNVQQAAVNLNRLELTMRTGGFGAQGIVPAPTVDIKYVGLSLGSIVGSYYLAGNTTLATTGYPYTQTTLNSDMKGFLSVPGGRVAYLMQNSPAFSSTIDAGLLAVGIAKNSPTYHNFFQVTQSVFDPVDPATMTTPLASGLPSRLSGRIAIQEAVGDQVIPNANTRYLGNALGGREVLGIAGAAVAPGFSQLGYLGAATPRIPTTFMYTLAAGGAVPKTAFAAVLNATTSTPSEGYFQFDQAGISHGFLIDPSVPANITLAQTQMLNFLLRGAVVDPTVVVSPTKQAGKTITAPALDISFPATFKILGY